MVPGGKGCHGAAGTDCEVDNSVDLEVKEQYLNSIYYPHDLGPHTVSLGLHLLFELC